MGLLKSGFMQPVEDTTPIEESEETNPGGATLISDIPDDAFGHVLFWLPPLTNLAAARVAKQWRVRVAKFFATLRELDVTTEEMSASLVRGASGPERWGRKSSRLAMLLGKCRSLESLTVGFGEYEESLGECPSHLLRSLSLRRLVIAGDYMTPDCVHNIARLSPNLEEFKWRDDFDDSYRVLGYGAVGTLRVLHRHCRRLRRLPPFGCCCSRGPLEPDGPCGYEAEAFELLKTWPSLEAIEIHQCFPLSIGEMRDRALGFGTDKGQFKGILRVVMHDLDDLVFDEVAGGEVPAELILQRDFGKNERRPLRFGTIEDLPPY